MHGVSGWSSSPSGTGSLCGWHGCWTGLAWGEEGGYKPDIPVSQCSERSVQFPKQRRRWRRGPAQGLCFSLCVCVCRYLLGLFPKWPSLCAQVLVTELQVQQAQSCSNADKNPGNNWLQRGSVRGWVPTPPLQRRVRIRRSVFSQTVNHPCRAKNSPLTESMMQFVTFMFCPHVLSVLTKVEGAPLWCREVMPDEMQNCIRIPSTIQTQPFHHPCGFFFAFQDIMMQ